jgi:hypothetical protein
MHAALVSLTIDPDQAPAAAAALTRDILPKIRSAPGFVAGYWLTPRRRPLLLVRRVRDRGAGTAIGPPPGPRQPGSAPDARIAVMRRTGLSRRRSQGDILIALSYPRIARGLSDRKLVAIPLCAWRITQWRFESSRPHPAP